MKTWVIVCLCILAVIAIYNLYRGHVNNYSVVFTLVGTAIGAGFWIFIIWLVGGFA